MNDEIFTVFYLESSKYRPDPIIVDTQRSISSSGQEYTNICRHQLWLKKRFSSRRLALSLWLGEFGGRLCNSRVVQVKQCSLCGVGQRDYETKTGAD